MARIQHIRSRIKSVKNIRQITKAMEMVSASKLRRAQEATLRSRTYAIATREALARLRLLLPDTHHPLFARRPVHQQLLILFTSDRGLAGSYNANVLKACAKVVAETTDSVRTQIIVVGTKGAQFVGRLNDSKLTVVGSYTNWPAQPTSQDIRPIATTAIQGFTEGTIDSVHLIYTNFVSLLRQTVTVRQLLPIDPQTVLPSQEATKPLMTDIGIEPSALVLTDYVVPRIVEMQIYQASLEAAASEQAMRMMAMRSASDNASDVMGALTLMYNGVRQAAITQELAEISAGTQALS